MQWNFSAMERLFSTKGKSALLAEGHFGIELEAQRITATGDLALTPHPAVFGDKAENPHITTDFSESQLEMITSPFDTVEETYNSLKEIYAEVEKGLNNEMLWPLSMPPRLPEEELIPVAKFSTSKEAQEKEVYRNGLVLRYGKKMQMISGIHYNFSFSEGMLDYLYEQFGGNEEKRLFIDNIYFAITRNFLRYRWLLIYLFGASPSYDSTYYSVICKELDIVERCCPECCDPTDNLNKYATSLRVSRFGYSNSLQRRYKIYFDSLEEYTQKLKRMLAKAHSKYLKLGLYKDGVQVQLNGNVLQKESEFYSSIRLKQITNKNETQLNALAERGVKYLEVRILDLNPFEKLGMSLTQLHFLQVFMLYCLFEKSDNITSSELKKINSNHHLAALLGRKKGLLLNSYDGGTISLKSFGEEIFKNLDIIAKLMDKNSVACKYQESVYEEYQKLMDISLLPSEIIFQKMAHNNRNFLEFGIKQAVNNSQINSMEDFDYDNKELQLRRA